MSSGPAADIDYSKIQWTEATSANGVPYRMGTTIPDAESSDPSSDTSTSSSNSILDAPAAGAPATAAAHAQGASRDVHWPVTGGHDAPWVDVDVSPVRISRYSITRGQGGPVGESPIYTLYITNTGGWGFWFTDEEGDRYWLSTVVNRNHWFEYKSNKPTIVTVVCGT